MKKILTLAALVGATTVSFAQGTVNFANTASTLIQAGGVSMPISGTRQFNFAVFLAPSTTTVSPGAAPSFTAPAFQVVGGTNVNSPTAVGRLVTRTAVDVGTSSGALGAGSTVDFIVRGWSANAGATWQEALVFWNNGLPVADMYIGSSGIADNLVLGGGAIGNTALFGAGANQVTGFTMGLVSAVIVPEPTSMVLAGLGAASLLAFRRRK